MTSSISGATKRYAVLSTASTSTTPISAVSASTQIVVVSLFIVVTTAVTVQFKTSTGAVAVTGAMPFGANGGISLPYNEHGWFRTATGDDLTMTLGSGVAVAGGIQYVAVNS